MGNKRGSIAFFSTYRPPVPLDIFSWRDKEVQLTDGASYNYNGHVIPPAALGPILARLKLGPEGYTGMAFVSERDAGLEKLHFAISFDGKVVKTVSLAEACGVPDDQQVRMEDSPCFAGYHVVYVSTKDTSDFPLRQPWTVVYKTDLKTGHSTRLTRKKVADLSPSVSPSGKRVAVASFEGKGGWAGEITDLKTAIYVMDIETKKRYMVVGNGGWPSWGSETVLFFHRRDEKTGKWGVYRADIGDGKTVVLEDKVRRVTPDNADAMTPAAIGADAVAVAIIRKASTIAEAKQGRDEDQYRHIEIFDFSPTGSRATVVTRTVTRKADHYNPFVIDAEKRIIGYHRCSIKDNLLKGGRIESKLEDVKSPHKDVDVFRAPGAFPTFTRDGKKMAFVDNEFKSVWVADDQGLSIVYKAMSEDRVFSTVWCQSPNSDTLYVCMGPSFKSSQELHIHAIPEVSKRQNIRYALTEGDSNNAFPSTSPDGEMVVFRSTRDGGTGEKRFKSLYIVDSYGENLRRLTTEENCTDTHCQWSPNGDWIVFSSDRQKPKGKNVSDNGLDSGYFSVYLVNHKNPSVVVKVMESDKQSLGHINHPMFSPDGKSIVVVADLAAVSVDPISMPLTTHSVRPYGDIFTFDIDVDKVNKSTKPVKTFTRVTHSRYENSTATWTNFDPRATSLKLDFTGNYKPACPYIHGDGGHSWHMTGHLCIPKSCC